mmetsp:Transcript_34556/g.50625  ORF Transcript_34556/g.50625 Transcript_34556/m.50625 type:complete len:86 (+) Transcript_34556:526-783(+)
MQPSGQVQQGREMWSGLSGRDEKSAPMPEEEREALWEVRRFSRVVARSTSLRALAYSFVPQSEEVGSSDSIIFWRMRVVVREGEV